MNKIVSTFCLTALFCILNGRVQTYPQFPHSNSTKQGQAPHSNFLQENQAIYKTSLKIPDEINPQTELKIYYKGDQLPIKNGSFLFKEDANAHIINILFTEASSPEFIESLTPTKRISAIKTKAKSRYFHLSRKNNSPESNWEIEEITINDSSFKVPLDRTIIILMNTAHLGKNITDVFKHSHNNNSKTIINLPTIILAKLLEQSDKQATLCAQLSAIDLNTIHSKPKQDSCHQIGSKIITFNQSCSI